MSHPTKHVSSSLELVVANTFFQRAVGLLGRSHLRRKEGMYFPNARSVHTFGMLFAIDVVYINEYGEIIEIHHSLRPFRISWCRRAHSLCELAQGVASELGLQKGQGWPIHSHTGDRK
jgi:uncharacterized protein